MTRDALALAIAALLAGFSSGCSTQLDPEVEVEPVFRPPPALLTFLTPLHDQLLGDADDVAPDEPGLQIDIMVEVKDLENELSLADINLRRAGTEETWTLPVLENGSGRFAVLERLTVSDGLSPGAGQFTAWVQLEDEETPRGEASVTTQLLALSQDACSSSLTLGGDLRIESPADLPTSAECLSITGDLIIASTDLVDAIGFESIISVGGDLVIENNPSLHSLEALTGLTAIGGDLLITGNPALPTDDAERLIERIGSENIGGAITIEGNLSL